METATPLDDEEEFLTAADGTRLYSCRHPVSPSVGLVLLVHGLGEHSGRYGHLIRYFQDAGLSTVRMDLRGHGRSEGPRGHAPSYDQLLDDLSLMLAEARARFPHLPVILYGHSLGGNLVANWCLRRRDTLAEIAGVVLSSPWLELTEKPTPFKSKVIHWLGNVWPSLAIPARFRPRKLTRDPEAIDRYENDPLVHFRVTTRLVSSAYDAGLWALEHAGEFPLPLLGLHGAADPITSPAATALFCERAPDSEFILFENLVHEPHNEPEWPIVLGKIRHWILDRVSQFTREHSPQPEEQPESGVKQSSEA
ncbi:lysophospholipase [Planctomicrobium sp. SH664]|uniref:alpha/beta hydrolase n=1 Tax=Planctomicrobium sp. SH664 TaxID=3448125 RepID=UPI003F5B6CE8